MVWRLHYAQQDVYTQVSSSFHYAAVAHLRYEAPGPGLSVSRKEELSEKSYTYSTNVVIISPAEIIYQILNIGYIPGFRCSYNRILESRNHDAQSPSTSTIIYSVTRWNENYQNQISQIWRFWIVVVPLCPSGWSHCVNFYSLYGSIIQCLLLTVHYMPINISGRCFWYFRIYG